jgi:hypothetical protein
MKYLLDSNILQAYTAKHPTLTRNLSSGPIEHNGATFIVALEQLRGCFDAYLKAESKILLGE